MKTEKERGPSLSQSDFLSALCLKERIKREIKKEEKKRQKRQGERKKQRKIGDTRKRGDHNRLSPIDNDSRGSLPSHRNAQTYTHTRTLTHIHTTWTEKSRR